MSPILAEVLTLAEVESLAGTTTFARGKAYFHDGAVSRLEEHEGAVRASVRGTRRYSVELGIGDHGTLTYECNCPEGDEGIFCKHAVAVALSWLLSLSCLACMGGFHESPACMPPSHLANSAAPAFTYSISPTGPAT